MGQLTVNREPLPDGEIKNSWPGRPLRWKGLDEFPE
jgi:hypothetical protein